MNWVLEAKSVFNGDKPEHFTNYNHCDECAEHDQTLVNNTIDTIGMSELGNPGWDPLCFSSSDGIRYYMPALIRLSLETIDKGVYIDQLLFHLDYGGKDLDLMVSCSEEQRVFITNFLTFVIANHTEGLDILLDRAKQIRNKWADE